MKKYKFVGVPGRSRFIWESDLPKEFPRVREGWFRFPDNKPEHGVLGRRVSNRKDQKWCDRIEEG